MTTPDISQEYDCPASGIDIDLIGDEILVVGEQCYCHGCGGNHTAGIDGPKETMITLQDGERVFRGLPKNTDEKTAWIAEARRS